MFLQLLRQGNGVEIVVAVDGLPQGLVILLFYQHLVQRLVHRLVVVTLYRAKVRLDQIEVPTAGEEGDGTGMVQTRREDDQEVVDEEGLMVKVELQGLVIEFNVGHLGDDFLEEALLPGLCGMGHHGQGRVVVLLILVVKEHQLRPQVSLLRSSQHLHTYVCTHK